jgi:hypothetical protein
MGMDVNQRTIGKDPPVKRANQAAPQPAYFFCLLRAGAHCQLGNPTRGEMAVVPVGPFREGRTLVDKRARRRRPVTSSRQQGDAATHTPIALRADDPGLLGCMAWA